MVDKGQNLNLKYIFHIKILYFEKKFKNFNQVQEKKFAGINFQYIEIFYEVEYKMLIFVVCRLKMFRNSGTS